MFSHCPHGCSFIMSPMTLHIEIAFLFLFMFRVVLYVYFSVLCLTALYCAGSSCSRVLCAVRQDWTTNNYSEWIDDEGDDKKFYKKPEKCRDDTCNGHPYNFQDFYLGVLLFQASSHLVPSLLPASSHRVPFLFQALFLYFSKHHPYTFQFYFLFFKLPVDINSLCPSLSLLLSLSPSLLLSLPSLSLSLPPLPLILSLPLLLTPSPHSLLPLLSLRVLMMIFSRYGHLPRGSCTLLSAVTQQRSLT